MCTTHEAFHLMFNTAVSTTYPEAEPAIGDIGERISVGSVFDGWGYVHLFARNGNTLTEVDTFAIPEAHDPAFAFGFGDLVVRGGDRPAGSDPGLPVVLQRWTTRGADPVHQPSRHNHL